MENPYFERKELIALNEKREIIFKTKDKYLKELDASLAGRVYHLAMDDGEEYELRFATDRIVEWRRPGEALRYEEYGALRADCQVYFIASILSGTDQKVCVTLVLDLEQSLVTMAISRQGYYPKLPRLAVVDFVFGAIRVPDQPLPVKRHGFTRELAYKKITWHYATGFINTHYYQGERFCRIRPLTDTRTPEAIEQEKREIEAGLKPRPMLYEEPMRFIKIKDGMYLISNIEANMNRVDPNAGGNNLMFITNLNSGCDYGRTFSRKADMSLDHGFFVAFGEPTDEDFSVIQEPSPYRV